MLTLEGKIRSLGRAFTKKICAQAFQAVSELTSEKTDEKTETGVHRYSDLFLIQKSSIDGDFLPAKGPLYS